MIYKEAVNDLDFSYSKEYLRQILVTMGFVYRRRKNNSAAMIERSDIVAMRCNFLRNIKQYRKEGRPIIYLDETWLNQGYTRERGWQDTETLKNPCKAKRDGLTIGTVDKPSGQGKRLMIVHAGSKEGFVPNAFWAFRALQEDGDYHKNMDAFVFEKWFKEQLLPNIPPSSIIVMDNASYHSRRTSSYPLSTWTKHQLTAWLALKGIAIPPDALRAECWELAKRHRMQSADYVCDTAASEKGHTVLRLPPYHSELNPIELIWARIKGYVAERNTRHTIAETRDLLEEAVKTVTPILWEDCCRHIVAEEETAWQRDICVEAVMEPVIINIADSSSDCSSTTSDSEADSSSFCED